MRVPVAVYRCRGYRLQGKVELHSAAAACSAAAEGKLRGHKETKEADLVSVLWCSHRRAGWLHVFLGPACYKLSVASRTTRETVQENVITTQFNKG